MPNEDTMFLNTKVDILTFFDPDQLRKVTPDIEHKTYKKGESIVFKGEITEGFYIIKNGTVNITCKDAKNRPLTIKLVVGDFFGEMSVLEDQASSANIKAAEDNTEILMIPHASFRKLCEMEAFLLIALKKKADARKEVIAAKLKKTAES